ncbi:MAG TPA: DUF6109 family natural product biosynthesis protein [Polyangiaceae bacterium]|nr:DUF6109 family natural product biosynthesis protein [Polyangiaceae bacterium]
MSKADARRDKQLKRELENLERGLRRGSAELVLTAIAELSGAALASKLAEPARALLASDLEAACRKRDIARLSSWVRALGRDSSLLERWGAASDEQIWVLLWTSVKAQSYRQAEGLWGTLADRVRADAPELAIAIEAIIRSRGSPDPALVPMLGPVDGDLLGIEPLRPRRSQAELTLPVEPAEAEARLLEARATASWSSFVASARHWLLSASPACAARLCAPLAELALLEWSEASQRGPAREQEVAGLVLAADRRLAELAHSHPALVEPSIRERLDRALSLLLRAAFSALLAAADQPVRGDWIPTTLARAQRLVSLKGAIATALSQLPSCQPLAPLAPQLQELHERAATPALWARAALALDYAAERRVERGGIPSDSAWNWITAGLRRHLAVPRELLSALSTLAPRERTRLLDLLEAVLEPELGVQVVEALFQHADTQDRPLLLSLARSALAQAADLPFCEECGVYHLSSHTGELHAFVTRSQRGLTLARRLSSLLLSHDEIFLQIALAYASSAKEQRQVLERYLAPGVPIDNYVDALEHARRLKLSPKPFLERLREAFAGQLSSLSRGFQLSLQRSGSRRSTSRELAELLLSAADQSAPEALSTATRRQLQLARRIARGSRKRSNQPPRQLSLAGVR